MKIFLSFFIFALISYKAHAGPVSADLFNSALKEVYLLLPEKLKKELPENPQFLRQKLNEEAARSQMSLKHAIVHELAHFYDEKRGSISKTPDFYLKAGFKHDMLGLKNKNVHPQRPISAQELESPEEAFALNFEYFLLDPKYRCRKPLMYKYFMDLSGSVPNESADCQSSDTLMVSTAKGPKPVKIDITRLYRIDYLLAAPGRDISSGFGHSMFRLVICGAKTPFGPLCLKDKMSHLVLSYRASIEEPGMNYFKGLVGGYPSLLYILNFSDVLHQYNEEELRDLIVYPFQFNDVEKKIFMDKVLEEHWNYRGDYKFISNNCAVESLDLVKAAIDNKQLLALKSITPKRILDDFISAGLILSANHTEILPGKLEQLLKSFHEAFGGKKDKKKLLTFIDQSSASGRLERLNQIEKIIVSDIDLHTELILRKEQLVKASALSVLEQQILLIKSAGLKKKMVRFLEKEKDHAGLKNIQEKYERKLRDYSPFIVETGYGIPLSKELDFIDRSEEIDLVTSAMTKEIQEFLKENFYVESHELFLINKNIEAFNNFSIKLRKQYKGRLDVYLQTVLFNLTLETNSRSLLLLSLHSNEALKEVRGLLDNELFSHSEINDSRLRSAIAATLPK